VIREPTLQFHIIPPAWLNLVVRPENENISMNNVILPSLMQLLAQAPVLLVYLAGLILALVFWRRCPTPCLLVFVATVVLLLLTMIHPFLSGYFIQARTEMGWTHEKLGSIFSAIALTTSCLRAAALGLLLAAAFIHRVSPSLAPNKALQATAAAPGS
jgi:hypothetical protein